jgi:hypothetical protein
LSAGAASERSRSKYGAGATLPTLLAFIEFAGVKLLRMTGFAITAVAAIEAERHVYILRQIVRYCPRNFGFGWKLLITNWR